MNNLEKYEIEKLRQEGLEHRDILLAIASIIKTTEGKKLFSYLFKSLDVTVLPDQSMSGEMLHEYLGFLRAGNAIYKLACEADSEQAASILAETERKRYADIYHQHRLENGLDNTDNS